MGSRERPSGFARARVRTLALSAAALGALLAVPAALLAAEPTGPTAATGPAVDAQRPSPTSAPGDPAPPGTSSDHAQPEPPAASAGVPPDQDRSASVPTERAVLASARVAAKASSVSIVGASFSAFAYQPKTLTVDVGTKVRWDNKSSAPEGHTVTGDGLDSGTLHQGDGYSFKFSKAGTYSYICAFHSNMTGKVKVLGSGSGGGGGGGGGGSSGGDSANGGGSSSSSSTGGGTSTSGFGATAGDPGGSGQLPLTGMPLLPLAGVGVGLVLLGALLSRLEFY